MSNHFFLVVCFSQLTEICFSHSPIDHGILESSSQTKEQWQKTIHTKAFFTGYAIQDAFKCEAINFHICKGKDSNDNRFKKKCCM